MSGPCNKFLYCTSAKWSVRTEFPSPYVQVLCTSVARLLPLHGASCQPQEKSRLQLQVANEVVNVAWWTSSLDAVAVNNSILFYP